MENQGVSTPIIVYKESWFKNTKVDYDNHVVFDNYSVSISITYNGTKTIKYITFCYEDINRVGDVIERPALKYTGPFKPGLNYFDDCWKDYDDRSQEKRGYNRVLHHIELVFMDNTMQTVSKNQIALQQKKSGCYVATCVYGSYDCPEVWTLRRYRDNTLGATWYGRLFIRAYYAISPTLVKWFGETKWFKKLWRGKLDRMVKKLQAQGVESTKYTDKNW